LRWIIFLFLYLHALTLDQINSYRKRVHLNSLAINPVLSQAAKLHADYIDKTHIVSHYERNPERKTPSLRALYSGYNSRFVIENLSVGNKSFKDSVDSLFGVVYHRLGFLDFNVNEIGFYRVNDIYVYELGNSNVNKACTRRGVEYGIYGICRNKKKVINSEIFKSVAKRNPLYIIWPYNGMQNVDIMANKETPDPLPGLTIKGYPITVSFNKQKVKDVKLLNFSFSERMKSITSKNDINSMLDKYQYAFFPLKPLKYNTKYCFDALFEVDGVDQTVSTCFKTKKPNGVVIIAKKRNYIKSNKTYIVRFKKEIDKLSYEYYEGVKINKISFKSANEILLNIKGQKGDKFNIMIGKQKFEFIIF
jgi:hypothetical protein